MQTTRIEGDSTNGYSAKGTEHPNEDRAGAFALGNAFSKFSIEEIKTIMDDAIYDLGNYVYGVQKKSSYPYLNVHVGSTLTAVVINPTKENTQVITVNTGDSVAYTSYKEGNAWKCQQSTLHDINDESEQDRIKAIDHNRIGRGDYNELRINGGINLSRSIGDYYSWTNFNDLAEAQESKTKPNSVPRSFSPATNTYPLPNNTTVAIAVASDGIYEKKSQKDSVTFLNDLSTLLTKAKENADSLSQAMIEAASRNGSTDDKTAIARMYKAGDTIKPELLFVADGHGGSEISEFIKRNLAYFVARQLFITKVKKGDYSFTCVDTSGFDEPTRAKFKEFLNTKSDGDFLVINFLARKYNDLGIIDSTGKEADISKTTMEMFNHYKSQTAWNNFVEKQGGTTAYFTKRNGGINPFIKNYANSAQQSSSSSSSSTQVQAAIPYSTSKVLTQIVPPGASWDDKIKYLSSVEDPLKQLSSVLSTQQQKRSGSLTHADLQSRIDNFKKNRYVQTIDLLITNGLVASETKTLTIEIREETDKLAWTFLRSAITKLTNSNIDPQAQISLLSKHVNAMNDILSKSPYCYDSDIKKYLENLGNQLEKKIKATPPTHHGSGPSSSSSSQPPSSTGGSSSSHSPPAKPPSSHQSPSSRHFVADDLVDANIEELDPEF